jgi:hypothetical protein
MNQQNNQTPNIEDSLDRVEEFVQKVFAGYVPVPADLMIVYTTIYNIVCLDGRDKLLPRMTNLLETYFAKLQEHIRIRISTCPCDKERPLDQIFVEMERVMNLLSNVFRYEEKTRKKEKSAHQIAQELQKQYILQDDIISTYIQEHKVSSQ